MATDAATIENTAAREGEAPPADEAPKVPGLADFYDDPAGDVGASDDAADSGEEDSAEIAEPVEEAPPIDAPKSWSKEDRDGWSGIPRAQQEVITRREAERDRHLREVTTRASQTEQRVSGEARQAIRGLIEGHAAQIEQYAQMFNVAQPDLRLLNSQNPEDRDVYFQQEAQYRASAAHREQANRQMQEARQQLEALQQQEQQLAAEEFHKVLSDNIPEWSDPSERANLLASLEPIAAELGYSAEVMREANASDILALRTAHAWKADAEKYRELMKRKMAPVRAAKQIPPTARVGSPAAMQQQKRDVLSTLYPND